MITKFKIFENKEDDLINYLDDNYKFKQFNFSDYYWLVCEGSDYEIVIKNIVHQLAIIKGKKFRESFADILYRESDFKTVNDFIKKINEIKYDCEKENQVKKFKI